MERNGIGKQDLEMMLLDVTEGILVGGLSGFLLGVLLGTIIWCALWQSLPTVASLPPVFYAGQLGTVDGAVMGAVVAFGWRLRMVLKNNPQV